MLPFKQLLQNLSEINDCDSFFPNGILTLESEIYNINCDANKNLLSKRPKLFVICAPKKEEQNSSEVDNNLNQVVKGKDKSDKRIVSNASGSELFTQRCGASQTETLPSILGNDCNSTSFENGINGLALLDLERKVNNLGFNQYSIDLFGDDMEQMKELFIESIELLLQEEAGQKLFYIMLQCNAKFEKDFMPWIEGLITVDVIYNEVLILFEKQCR